jgi:hypothetical protein
MTRPCLVTERQRLAFSRDHGFEGDAAWCPNGLKIVVNKATGS